MISEEDLREKIWREASDALFVEREDYMRQLAAFRVAAVYDAEGDLFLATLKRGPEFHFVVFKKNTKNFTRRFILQVLLKEQLDEYGYVTTRTPVDDLRQRRFNTTFGWQVTGQDALDVHFRYEAKSCRS